MPRAQGGIVEAEVRPPWPYRLPSRGGGDGVLRISPSAVGRLMHVGACPVLVVAWQRRDGSVVIRASGRGPRDRLELAVERMRFAIGVDEDLSEFYARFRSDPLVGPAVRRRPWLRPKRRIWPWEALAWAITEQLIESSRAAAIQRRIVRRWGPSLEAGEASGRPASRSHAQSRARRRRGWTYADVPGAELFAGLAPAELVALDLSAARSLALVRCAREVAHGRADPADPSADPRFRRVSEIGPWTLQCLGYHGRGEPDSLPAGDLAYVKLVGHLAGLGRRASVEEVEEFFAPYAPFRGLAGTFALSRGFKSIAAGPPLSLAA